MSYFPPPSAAAGQAQANAEAYTDAQLEALVNLAPPALDTLKELADALGDDPAFATHITPRPLAAVDGKVVKWVEADSRLEDATADLAATFVGKAASQLRFEDFGGGPAKTGAQNAAALAAAIAALGAAGGLIYFSQAAIYDFAAATTIPRDVILQGVAVPGADPQNPPAGTRIRRTADTVVFNLIGTNRATDRVGRAHFRNLQFLDSANISANPFFNTKWADSLVFIDCLFWQPAAQVTSGHYISAEECWDWLFVRTIFKFYGNATHHALNIFNGATDNSNGWRFLFCRWQEGQGSAVNFDSSGAGTSNHDFDFFGCKFEDTANASKTHITGKASDVHIFGGQIAGCGERQISQPATATRWLIDGVTFANGGAAATEMVELLGNRSRVAGCTFQNPGAGVTRYINVTGAENEVTGCDRVTTTVPLVNAAGVDPLTKIHHNPNFVTEYSSQAQILSGTTTIVVNHNLAYTPAAHHIMVCPASALGAAAKFWVSGVGATQFTINVDVNPGATVTFNWWAMRVRG